IVLARGPGSLIEKGLHSDSRGIEGAGIARRSRSFPWFDEVEKQNGGERNNERGANQRRASCLEGIRQVVLEDVDPATKKGHDEEAGKASEGAREPAATDQGLGRTHRQSVMDDLDAHGQSSGESRRASAGSGDRKKSR